jgi:hypothetical protein
MRRKRSPRSAHLAFLRLVDCGCGKDVTWLGYSDNCYLCDNKRVLTAASRFGLTRHEKWRGKYSKIGHTFSEGPPPGPLGRGQGTC